MKASSLRVVMAAVAAALLRVPLGAQDRLKAMPGYDQYQKMSREIPGSVKLGSINAQWKDVIHPPVQDGRLKTEDGRR